MMFGLLLRLLLLTTCLLLPLQLWAAPQVVVSIKPLAGLVEGVMQGVERPQLLLPGGASPHSYALRPSQMRALMTADLVVWVGPELESFLARALQEKRPEQLLQLTTLVGVKLLPAREGGEWEGSMTADDGEHHHDHAGVDPHLWLDPANARVLVMALADALARLDPAHAATYRQNVAELDRRLAELQQELTAQLASVRQSPYLVFHDAYQYFERAFDLHPVGTLAVQPERPPGARRIRDMRQIILEKKVGCVFSEPQFEPRVMTALTEGTSVSVGELDPIGADLPEGTDSYFTLLRNMGSALVSCLDK